MKSNLIKVSFNLIKAPSPCSALIKFLINSPFTSFIYKLEEDTEEGWLSPGDGVSRSDEINCIALHILHFLQ